MAAGRWNSVVRRWAAVMVILRLILHRCNDRRARRKEEIMSEDDNKVLVRRYYDEVLNGGSIDLLEELAVADYVEHNPFPGQGNAVTTSRPEHVCW